MDVIRRKERRHITAVNVQCSCRRPEECTECNVPGMSLNASTSGMCIYTLASFKRGTRLNVECKYNGIVRKNAVVKWCKEIPGEDLYRIGLAFDET
jgi:hypothetical protein